MDFKRTPDDEGGWRQLWQGELLYMSLPGLAHAIVIRNASFVHGGYAAPRRERLSTDLFAGFKQPASYSLLSFEAL